MNFEKRVLRLDAAGLLLEYFLVPWDTEIFGFPVAQIERIEVLGDTAAVDFGQFEDWRSRTGIRLVSCRLSHDQLGASMFLEDRGFRFVEMVYSPRLDSLEALLPASDAPSISTASPEDIPIIEEIAGHAFLTGRFLLDRRLDPELSAKRYRVWVRNSFANPRHTVLKATIGTSIVGFFIVEERTDGCAYWHLTAIAPDWQGRGVGRALWTAMAVRHREAGCRRVETTISAHNTPVINLYARLGFRFQPADMTFHWVA